MEVTLLRAGSEATRHPPSGTIRPCRRMSVDKPTRRALLGVRTIENGPLELTPPHSHVRSPAHISSSAVVWPKMASMASRIMPHAAAALSGDADCCSAAHSGLLAPSASSTTSAVAASAVGGAAALVRTNSSHSSKSRRPSPSLSKRSTTSRAVRSYTSRGHAVPTWALAKIWAISPWPIRPLPSCASKARKAARSAPPSAPTRSPRAAAQNSV
mmetsp:Transcript_111772/g.312442  ORF Transcript_111772/g.312442 Transcript_111772/m.312442 type:complete len:214 (+) Transcript_111772:1-642(+)